MNTDTLIRPRGGQGILYDWVLGLTWPQRKTGQNNPPLRLERVPRGIYPQESTIFIHYPPLDLISPPFDRRAYPVLTPFDRL